MFVPSIAQQVQSSAETAAADTNEELVQRVVMGGSAWCSCVSCYSSSSLSCPIGCSARFCLAACFATHQPSRPFVTFAKPVMITFHESLKGPSIRWAVAQQGVPVLFNPCSVMSQRSFSATGCFTAGSMHPLARSPTVEFWASLRPWFEYFQHIELNLSGSRAALGRSRAQVRDAGRVLSGLVSRFRQALLDGSFWLALLPKRGKFWGSQELLNFLKENTVFQSPVLSWSCSGFTSVVQSSTLLCPAFPVARLLFQKWSFHQASSCQRPRSWPFQKCVWSCFVLRPKCCCHNLRFGTRGYLPSWTRPHSVSSVIGRKQWSFWQSKRCFGMWHLQKSWSTSRRCSFGQITEVLTCNFVLGWF